MKRKTTSPAQPTTQPAVELVDVLGNPITLPPPAVEIIRCLCGAPATTELFTCGRFECGRF